jgi:hypothetical protein
MEGLSDYGENNGAPNEKYHKKRCFQNWGHPARGKVDNEFNFFLRRKKLKSAETSPCGPREAALRTQKRRKFAEMRGTGGNPAQPAKIRANPEKIK